MDVNSRNIVLLDIILKIVEVCKNIQNLKKIEVSRL